VQSRVTNHTHAKCLSPFTGDASIPFDAFEQTVINWSLFTRERVSETYLLYVSKRVVRIHDAESYDQRIHYLTVYFTPSTMIQLMVR